MDKKHDTKVIKKRSLNSNQLVCVYVLTKQTGHKIP